MSTSLPDSPQAGPPFLQSSEGPSGAVTVPQRSIGDSERYRYWLGWTLAGYVLGILWNPLLVLVAPFGVYSVARLTRSQRWGAAKSAIAVGGAAIPFGGVVSLYAVFQLCRPDPGEETAGEVSPTPTADFDEASVPPPSQQPHVRGRSKLEKAFESPPAQEQEGKGNNWSVIVSLLVVASAAGKYAEFRKKPAPPRPMSLLTNPLGQPQQLTIPPNGGGLRADHSRQPSAADRNSTK